jgi:hypothetical protein
MLSPLLPLKKTILNPERPLSWFFLIVFTIYAWSQSMMFIFEYNLDMNWAIILSRLLLLYLALHLISFLYVKPPRIFVTMGLLYIGIMFLYALLEFVLDNDSQLLKGTLKTFIVTLLMLRIMATDKSLNRLLLINFFFGFVAVLLSTVPLLAASGFIDLHGTPIPRVGGETLRPDLDPISYGIFGLTENHVSSGKHFPRLQGWSSEPQNWGYLVFYILGIGVLAAKSIRNNIIVMPLLLFIIIHIWFIGSTAAYLSLVSVFAGFFLLVGLDRFNIVKPNHWLFLFLLILIPGLIIPFCLGAIPFFESYFLRFNLMGEGQNWIQKLSFLDYGSEFYFRSIPIPDDGSHSTHNFILNTYLDFGYIFLLPLVYFFYRFSCCVVSLPSYTMLLASCFWVVSNTLLNSRSFFLPVSGIFLMMLIGFSFYNRDGIANPPEQKTI